MAQYPKEPLQRHEALKLARQLTRQGSVVFSSHAKKEMKDDNLTAVDVQNIIERGVINEEAEYENESWRYRIHTPRLCVVVTFAFEGGQAVIVVTAWRKS